MSSGVHIKIGEEPQFIFLNLLNVEQVGSLLA